MRFVVEHAKRGQASCKFSKCKQKIEKGILRIGKVSPSPFAEGSEMTQWFHANCLFDQMKNPRAVKLESKDDLEGFDDLPDEDKQVIENLFQKLGDAAASSASATPKPKNRKKEKKKESSDEESESESEEEATPKSKKRKKPESKATTTTKKSGKKKKSDDSD